jgi:hypothetical protein
MYDLYQSVLATHLAIIILEDERLLCPTCTLPGIALSISPVTLPGPEYF